MNNLESFKELYDVFLKTTCKIEGEGFSFEPGEIIARFDKIQVAGLQEAKTRKAARGGFDNRVQVMWDDTKEVNLSFAQGVFSKLHFALTSNSKIAIKEPTEPVLLSIEEELESDVNGVFFLSQMPAGAVFVYSAETGKKLTFSIEEKEIKIETPFTNVIADYEYNYLGGETKVTIGQRLIPGDLILEGKTRVKNDTTGRVTTGIIKIPRLRLMSDLSMRLGNQANPVGAVFDAKGLPVGDRHNSYVMEFHYLNDDISSDF